MCYLVHLIIKNLFYSRRFLVLNVIKHEYFHTLYPFPKILLYPFFFLLPYPKPLTSVLLSR